MNEDELARIRAELDQAREGLKEFSVSVWSFYSELVDNGFTEAQALRLTVAFVTTTMRNAIDPGDS